MTSIWEEDGSYVISAETKERNSSRHLERRARLWPEEETHDRHAMSSSSKPSWMSSSPTTDAT